MEVIFSLFSFINMYVRYKLIGTNIIGASQSGPHINHSYEKIYMYVHVCSDTSSTCSSCCMRCNLVKIVNVYNSNTGTKLMCNSDFNIKLNLNFEPLCTSLYVPDQDIFISLLNIFCC